MTEVVLSPPFEHCALLDFLLSDFKVKKGTNNIEIFQGNKSGKENFEDHDEIVFQIRLGARIT